MSEYIQALGETNTDTLESLDEKLRDYLRTAPTPEHPRLWSTEELQELRALRDTEAIALLSSADSEPIELPTDSIIAVPNPNPDMKYIKKQARQLRARAWPRKQESTPPLISGRAIACIQPNGIVLTTLVNNGTHTALAAREAKLPFIRLHDQVSVYRLDHDIVPLPDQHAAA